MKSFRGFVWAVAVIIAAFICGCSTPKSDAVYAEVPVSSETAGVSEPAEQTQAPVADGMESQGDAVAPDRSDAEKPELIVTPDDMLTGSIVSVNEVGRFVVLKFPLGRMPTEGSTLFVYRNGMKVAELKVTGPQKDDHTVADIKTGDCRSKDEVRDR